MTQFNTYPQGTENSGRDHDSRRKELSTQLWTRGKSQAMAINEGIDFRDEHWEVIVFLRNYYLEYGLPMTARTIATAMEKNFSVQGGNKYLHKLFWGGPVTQGCRIANLRTPAYATDLSFGSCY